MGLFKSKKFYMAIVGVVGEIALYYFNVPLETSVAILAPVIAYIIGQGVADINKTH